MRPEIYIECYGSTVDGCIQQFIPKIISLRNVGETLGRRIFLYFPDIRKQVFPNKIRSPTRGGGVH